MGLDLRIYIWDVKLLGFDEILAMKGEGGIKDGSPISGLEDLVDGGPGTLGRTAEGRGWLGEIDTLFFKFFFFLNFLGCAAQHVGS